MKRIITSIASIVGVYFIFMLTSSCAPQNIDDDIKPAQSIEALKRQLEKVLEDMHVPGMSVAIVHRDGEPFVAGLGKADIASDRPATEDTLFRIGSVSKGFVSLAILMLTLEGKISLEDPLHKVAPEVWFENRFESSDPVRIVHLLEHTTGWDDLHLREYALDRSTIGLLEAFDYDHRSRISRFRPGTRMAYNNSGPAVAAYIVQKISGRDFEEYIAEYFFSPLGLKTATYQEPMPESITTLYHNDGKMPRTYWHFLYRPSGSINASANDMAAYLLFYLSRGNVYGKQVLPAFALDRMESPTSTWAAQEGLKFGYGLSNYWTVHDGFVYHGHAGGMEGGITDLAYMPDYKVGYFYSINSGNPEAFNKIGKIIRSYVARDLQKPSLPLAADLPANTSEYSGWYEPNSPRQALTYFIERLLGLAHVRFKEGKLLMSSFGQINATFMPTTAKQFRYVPTTESAEPVATLALITPNAEGRFIQIAPAMSTLKQIPGLFAIAEILISAFVLLSLISIIAYAPFWIFSGRSKKRCQPRERNILFLLFAAVLSLISIVAIFMLTSDDLIARMGNLSVWSLLVFLGSIFFALASLASLIALWRTPKQELRPIVRAYFITVCSALLIATAYLFYWGIIGLRTWA